MIGFCNSLSLKNKDRQEHYIHTMDQGVQRNPTIDSCKKTVTRYTTHVAKIAGESYDLLVNQADRKGVHIPVGDIS